MLVDQVKPPTTTELNPGSASDMAIYLRGCETRRQTVLWNLLHKDFVNELTWVWRSRQGEFKNAPNTFKDATIEQQIDWLESLYKRLFSGYWQRWVTVHVAQRGFWARQT